MAMDFSGKRVVVTGGAGFLGRAVLEGLQRRSVEDVAVPRRSEFDLTTERGVSSLYEEFRPDVIVHLAAEVGGIGANMDNPGRYFYANMAMSLHLIEFARRVNLEKFVQECLTRTIRSANNHSARRKPKHLHGMHDQRRS